jgi:hypothetical protein
MSTINVNLYVHHRIYAGCMSQRRRERKGEKHGISGDRCGHLVAPLAFLCGAQFIHLGDSLSEFIVLAFFIGMSFGLMVMRRVSKTRPSKRAARSRVSAYLTLPRNVVFFSSAAVKWDQQMGARVSVCKRKTSIRHLLVRG